MAFAFAAALFGQDFVVGPAAVKQGGTLHVRGAGALVRMDGRTAPLYAGSGLVGIPALQKPGTYPLEFLGADGLVIDTVTVTVRDAHFRTQNVELSKATAELQPSPGEMETVGEFKKIESREKEWAEPLLAPVPGCQVSPFGVKRLQNGKPTGNYHSGIDQRAPAGRPIVTVAGGVVRLVKSYNVHGNVVGVDHGQGLESLYLHMSKFAVKEGDEVKQGDVLGYAGSTGRSSAPHLHWGLYVHGVAVNPAEWVPLHACAAAASQQK